MNEELYVNTRQLAEVLGISVKMIYKLIKQGYLKNKEKNLFYLPDVVPAYVKYKEGLLETKHAKNDPKQIYDLEHAKHEKAKREKAEIQLQLMKGEVHAKEDVQRELNKMLTAFRARVLAIPSKMAPRLTGINNTNKIETMLRGEVNTALKELSDYDPARFKHKTFIDLEEEKEKE